MKKPSASLSTTDPEFVFSKIYKLEIWQDYSQLLVRVVSNIRFGQASGRIPDFDIIRPEILSGRKEKLYILEILFNYLGCFFKKVVLII